MVRYVPRFGVRGRHQFERDKNEITARIVPNYSGIWKRNDSHGRVRAFRRNPRGGATAPGSTVRSGGWRAVGLAINCGLKFQERGQLFIRVHNETLSVVPMYINNSDRLPFESIAKTPLHDVLIVHGLGVRHAETQGHLKA